MTRTGRRPVAAPVARASAQDWLTSLPEAISTSGRGDRPPLEPPQAPQKDTPLASRSFLLLVASSLASAVPVEGAEAAPEISAARIKAHVAYLANDRLEGRGPGTR